MKGYKLECSGVPQQAKMPRNIHFSTEKNIHMQKENDRFFNMGIIKKKRKS